MKEKKSSIYLLPGMVVISLFIFTYLYIVLLYKNAPFIENPIGKRQFDLLKTYVKAESTTFYIDQSAKYSLQQSIYELAQNGGFSSALGDEGISFETNLCGKFNGFNIWYQLKKDDEGNIVKISCFDEKLLLDNLRYKFDENLNQYLINHPHNIRTNNYDYEFKDSLEIIGRAKEPLIFEILKDETKEVIKKPTEIKIPIEFKEKEAKPEEKPKEGIKTEKPVEVKPSTAAKDFIDFTGTDLCEKGDICLLTNEAYTLLLKSQEISKQKGIYLKVIDAYRSQKEQIDIWEGRTASRYKQRYPDENVRRKYVCYPYGNDVEKRCPHLSGNAIDIVYNGKTTKTMTHSDWLILHDIMSKDGWVRYGDEKRFDVGERWHFECCGTNRYARATKEGVTAIV